LADFFKNHRDSGDKYKGVLRPDDAVKAVIMDGGANAVLFDPPYVTSPSGHTVLNCNLKVSKSLARKSFVYGIDFPYTEKQILFFYVNCFVLAAETKVLVDGGYLIMKAMDGATFPLTSFIEHCAGIFGFVRTGVSQVFPSASNGSQKESVLLVFSKSEADVLTFVNKKNTLRQQFVDEIREQARGDYLKAIKDFRGKKEMWRTGLDRIFSHLAESRDEFFERIRANFPGLLESSNLSGDADGVLSDANRDIGALQRYAVALRKSTLATANVFGICFASLLKTYLHRPCQVLELKEKIAIMKRVGFSGELVDTLERARVGLENLHENVIVLKGLLVKKRKAEGNAERGGGVKQLKLDRYVVRPEN
jgi:hypothetical protein